MKTSDTIVALATPAVPSAIALIRMSGPEAFFIASKIFIRKNGRKKNSFSSFRVYYGLIADSDDVIDEVLLTSMKGPDTFTGDDTIEISSHGSLPAVRKIIDLCIRNGARPACPGEFTRRAFISGKIDLVQAEAVSDLISASNDYSSRNALQQLRGDLSRHLSGISETLVSEVAHLEAYLDFPEDGISDFCFENLQKNISSVKNRLQNMIENSRFSGAFRDGVRVVISGPPNAGKSTLFNLLCGEERAIVTEHPGTTRDFLEKDILLDSLPVKLIDTAGLREASELAESIGIRKSLEILSGADLVVFLTIPGDQTVFPVEIFKKTCLILCNKTDLYPSFSVPEGQLPVSLITGSGFEHFIHIFKSLISRFFADSAEGAFMVNKRQKLELENAVSGLSCTLELIRESAPADIICGELKKTIFCMSSILGKITTEDILDQIFSSFCIGK